MEFCPKCGSRLEPKKSKTGKSLVMLVCPKGDFKKEESAKKVEPKIGKVIPHSPQQFVAVIGKEEQKLNTLPTVRMECPKCGNNTAFVWQVQTRGADESSTQFFRCTKCNHTYREMS